MGNFGQGRSVTWGAAGKTTNVMTGTLADVQLESEAFNRAFRLTATSQKLAYDLMPARNMDLLLNHPHGDLHTDGVGQCVTSVERRL